MSKYTKRPLAPIGWRYVRWNEKAKEGDLWTAKDNFQESYGTQWPPVEMLQTDKGYSYSVGGWAKPWVKAGKLYAKGIREALYVIRKLEQHEP